MVQVCVAVFLGRAEQPEDARSVVTRYLITGNLTGEVEGLHTSVIVLVVLEKFVIPGAEGVIGVIAPLAEGTNTAVKSAIVRQNFFMNLYYNK